MEACWAHNPEVGGSKPLPATYFFPSYILSFFACEQRIQMVPMIYHLFLLNNEAVLPEVLNLTSPRYLQDISILSFSSISLLGNHSQNFPQENFPVQAFGSIVCNKM